MVNIKSNSASARTKGEKFKVSNTVSELLDSYVKVYGGDRSFLDFEVWNIIRSSGTEEVIIADLKAKKPYREWSVFFEQQKKLTEVCAKRLEKPPGLVKGKYTCKNQKCKGDEFLIEPKQTRSADEGETLFCKCVDCGQVIKIRS